MNPNPCKISLLALLSALSFPSVGDEVPITGNLRPHAAVPPKASAVEAHPVGVNSRPGLPPYDHDNPIVLNEYALRYWVPRGDVETARILLARAVRLDPKNPTIAANLAAVERLQQQVGGHYQLENTGKFLYSTGKETQITAGNATATGAAAVAAPPGSLWSLPAGQKTLVPPAPAATPGAVNVVGPASQPGHPPVKQ